MIPDSECLKAMTEILDEVKVGAYQIKVAREREREREEDKREQGVRRETKRKHIIRLLISSYFSSSWITENFLTASLPSAVFPKRASVPSALRSISSIRHRGRRCERRWSRQRDWSLRWLIASKPL
jgi:hypothetical protein